MISAKTVGIVAAAGIALTGCGSTVGVTGLASNTGAVSAGLGSSTSAVDSTGSTQLPGSASTADGINTPANPGTQSVTTDASGTASQNGNDATSTSTTNNSAPSAVSSPGITPSAINIGVIIADNVGAANAAIGAGAVTHGDEQSEYRVKVAELNSHGGIAGRKIVLVEFHFDANTQQDAAQVEQQACAYFTQDHKVAMVVNLSLSPVGLQCLAAKKVVNLGGSLSISSDDTTRRFKYFLEPIGMNLTRLAPNYAKGLNDLNFFPAGAKIGLLTYDTPDFAKATTQLRAALKRYGRTITDVASVSPKSVGAAGADISSAVLRFRSDGISHVLFEDPSGVAELLFLNDAESQHYRPKYGFGQSGAAALRSTGVPAAQFVGSVTVGWFPRLDGVPANETQYPAAEKPCLALFARNGITFDSDNARRHADDICDSFDYATALLSSITSTITPDGIIAAARGLGVRQGAGSYSFHVGTSRSDGVNQVRYSAYAQACDCWHYVGGLRAAA